jgi:predicted small integral membrane protein
VIYRAGKTILTAVMGAYFLLIAFNNTTDYQSNFVFVQHVLSMDTIPANPRIEWRAIRSTAVHHAAYWAIIMWEYAAGGLCIAGCYRLQAAIQDRRKFQDAKPLAVSGLILGTLLWSFAFILVGGEWFLMWQSQVWNGQTAAARMFTLNMLALLFLCLPESAVDAADNA